MPRNYELRIDAAYRVTRDATRFVSIMLSGGLFSFFSFRDNRGLWVIAWIDRGIFLSTNRLVVSVVLRNFDVPELSGGLFLFFSFSFVRRKLCANSFASFTVQEIYGIFFF